MDITNSIRTLTKGRVLDTELFDTVKAIAAQFIEHKVNAGGTRATNAADEADELASDFMIALAAEEVSGIIRSRSDLRREFQRWITRRDAPEMQELWHVISEALLLLEKKGSVCRADSHKAYNNSNATPWALTAFAGRPADFSCEQKIQTALVKISAKGEHNRILKPAEAQHLVCAALETMRGEVCMGELVHLIADHLPMLRVTVRLDAPIGDDSDDTLGDAIEAALDYSDHILIIGEESRHASENIWQKAGTIWKGTRQKVEGQTILCCYLIPKLAFGVKEKLETYGPSSTVQDVVNELKTLLVEWLPTEGRKAIDQAINRHVTEGVLQDLVRRCSEKGFCLALYTHSNRQGTKS